MFSLLTSFFGCASSASTGPDFDDAITKVIHIDSRVHIHYVMPGNMSNLMDFSKRYKNEAPRSYSISIDKEVYKHDEWRMSHKVDGAMWDYTGTKKQGLGGDLGDLNLQLSVNKSDGNDIAGFIREAYDEFLNGASGPNTEIRKSEMGKGVSDADLGHWIIAAPKNIESVNINGTEYLHWSVNWRRGERYIYYALPIGEGSFFSFMFRYTIKAGSENEYEEQEVVVLADIRKIMERVSID